MGPSICAVVLAKNEEGNLAGCLPSLDWADEVVVVDNGSIDRTVLVAQAHGARVLSYESPYYTPAPMRNWVLTHPEIQSDWVLFVDADEFIPPELAAAIMRAIANDSDTIKAYRLCGKFYFLGKWLKHAAMFPAWHDRLCRRGHVHFIGLGTAGGHEHLEGLKDEEIGYIDVPYVHYSFQGMSHWLRKHEHYSTWVAEDVVRRKKEGIRLRGLPFSRGSERKRTLESIAHRLGPMAPIIRFVYLAFVRRGILDGWRGLLYCHMMATFEMMVYLKVVELERGRKSV